MSETATDGNGGAHTSHERGGMARVLLGVILLTAAALRLGAAGGDLWIDEIWSLDNIALARAQADGSDWLALFFHDNTHAVNTFYLALVGPDAGPFAYRALSVFTGLAAVAVAAAIGWRRSPLEGLIAAAMLAVSYPLVHYSGEARGYAPMLLAAVASFALLETILKAPSPADHRGRAGAFVAVTLLGMASQLTFLFVLAGLGLWAAMVLFRRRQPMVRTLAQLCVLFGLQAITITLYGAVAWNNLVIGGGAFVPALDAAVELAELTFGIDPAARGSAAAALALGLGVAVWWLRRGGETVWVFFAVVVLAIPLGLVFADPVLGMTPRYFIACAPFALIASGRGISALLTGNRWTRAVAGGLLAVFFIGNGLLLGNFFEAGRGQYAAAVAFIAAQNKSATPARTAGYHPFSVKTVLGYHARRQGLAGAVRYVDPEENARAPAKWFIDGHFKDRSPAVEISRPSGKGTLTPYKLKAVFPHWGLSGDTWAVYRRSG